MATTKMKLNPEVLRTRAVCGGAVNRRAQEHMLTHTVLQENETDVRVICNRIKFESMLDDPYSTEETEPPTCPVCLARDTRFKKLPPRRRYRPWPFRPRRRSKRPSRGSIIVEPKHCDSIKAGSIVEVLRYPNVKMLVEKPYGRESNCEDGCCPMVEDAFLALAEDGKPLPRGLEGESTNDFLACHVKRVYLPAEATP